VQNPEWNILTPKPDGWPTFPFNNTGLGYKVQSFDESLQRSFCIHFFHLLWNVQFWIFFTFTVICGAVAQWYFTPYVNDQKPRGDGEGQLPDRPIIASVWRTVRFHLGTVCFAALIVAIIQAIRAFVLYLEEKYRKANGGEVNCVMKCVFCCVNCCLSCIQKCIEQINRNGLVFVAVYGSPFCAATCNALGAAGSNLGRVAWVSMVGDFLIGIGKVFTALLSTGICGMILFSPEYSAKISTPSFLLVVSFIINWCIASLFMVVYETCIDTIFMCFLIDEDNNKATGKYLAHKDLLAVIGEGEAESKAQADAAPAKPTAQ
jgi:choline transporter-like protein 2/4/5